MVNRSFLKMNHSYNTETNILTLSEPWVLTEPLDNSNRFLEDLGFTESEWNEIVDMMLECQLL